MVNHQTFMMKSKLRALKNPPILQFEVGLIADFSNIQNLNLFGSKNQLQGGKAKSAGSKTC